jgi:NADH dehydrogenase FAD-containing subunit
MNGQAQHRVVIVGGGFGGLFAMRALRRGPFAVTLIDQSAHHLFQPLLISARPASCRKDRSPRRSASCSGRNVTLSA